MSFRPSPPLKPINLSHHHQPAGPSFRYKRYLYVLLTLVFVYLWQKSSFHLLPHSTPRHEPSLIYKNVDWARYAYSLYATNSAYLCNALMIFDSLSRLGSKADRVLFYPQEWDLEIESGSDRDSQLLVMARDEYGVKLEPSDGTAMKYLAWGLTSYERVLLLDSGVTVLKHMDGLFLAPKAPVALVRSYWELPQVKRLADLFVLLEPSESEQQQLTIAARSESRGTNGGDEDVVNKFYANSAMVLPHREYGLLSLEFRVEDHASYLGNTVEKWDPDKVKREASLVFFTDEPLPKPWVMWPHNLIGDVMPKCKLGELGNDDCRNKKIWSDLYDDFRKRRKDVCALLSAPAPEWPPRNTTREAD